MFLCEKCKQSFLQEAGFFISNIKQVCCLECSSSFQESKKPLKCLKFSSSCTTELIFCQDCSSIVCKTHYNDTHKTPKQKNHVKVEILLQKVNKDVKTSLQEKKILPNIVPQLKEVKKEVKVIHQLKEIKKEIKGVPQSKEVKTTTIQSKESKKVLDLKSIELKTIREELMKEKLGTLDLKCDNILTTFKEDNFTEAKETYPRFGNDYRDIICHQTVEFLKVFMSIYNTPQRKEIGMIFYGLKEIEGNRFIVKGVKEENVDENYLFGCLNHHCHPNIANKKIDKVKTDKKGYVVVCIFVPLVNTSIPMTVIKNITFSNNDENEKPSNLKTNEYFIRENTGEFNYSRVKDNEITTQRRNEIIDWFNHCVLESKIHDKPIFFDFYKKELDEFSPTSNFILISNIKNEKYLSLLTKFPWTCVLDFDETRKMLKGKGNVNNLQLIDLTDKVTDTDLTKIIGYYFPLSNNPNRPNENFEDDDNWNTNVLSHLSTQIKKISRSNTKSFQIIILWDEEFYLKRLKRILLELKTILNNRYKPPILFTDSNSNLSKFKTIKTFEKIKKKVIYNDPSPIEIDDFYFMLNYWVSRENFSNEKMVPFDINQKLIAIEDDDFEKTQQYWTLIYESIGNNTFIKDSDMFKGDEVQWYEIINDVPFKSVFFKNMLSDIDKNLKSYQQKNYTNIIKIYNIYHDPGAGGTTLAKMLAFHMRQKYVTLYWKEGKNKDASPQSMVQSIQWLTKKKYKPSGILLIFDGKYELIKELSNCLKINNLFQHFILQIQKIPSFKLEPPKEFKKSPEILKEQENSNEIFKETHLDLSFLKNEDTLSMTDIEELRRVYLYYKEKNIALSEEEILNFDGEKYKFENIFGENVYEFEKKVKEKRLSTNQLNYFYFSVVTMRKNVIPNIQKMIDAVYINYQEKKNEVSNFKFHLLSLIAFFTNFSSTSIFFPQKYLLDYYSYLLKNTETSKVPPKERKDLFFNESNSDIFKLLSFEFDNKNRLQKDQVKIIHPIVSEELLIYYHEKCPHQKNDFYEWLGNEFFDMCYIVANKSGKEEIDETLYKIIKSLLFETYDKISSKFFFKLDEKSSYVYKHEKSLEFMRNLVKKFKTVSFFYAQLAIHLYKARQYQESEENIEKAIKLAKEKEKERNMNIELSTFYHIKGTISCKKIKDEIKANKNEEFYKKLIKIAELAIQAKSDFQESIEYLKSNIYPRTSEAEIQVCIAEFIHKNQKYLEFCQIEDKKFIEWKFTKDHINYLKSCLVQSFKILSEIGEIDLNKRGQNIINKISRIHGTFKEHLDESWKSEFFQVSSENDKILYLSVLKLKYGKWIKLSNENPGLFKKALEYSEELKESKNIDTINFIFPIWLILIRYIEPKKLEGELEVVREQVKIWEKKTQTPLSYYYLATISSVLFLLDKKTLKLEENFEKCTASSKLLPNKSQIDSHIPIYFLEFIGECSNLEKLDISILKNRFENELEKTREYFKDGDKFIEKNKLMRFKGSEKKGIFIKPELASQRNVKFYHEDFKIHVYGNTQIQEGKEVIISIGFNFHGPQALHIESNK